MGFSALNQMGFGPMPRRKRLRFLARRRIAKKKKQKKKKRRIKKSALPMVRITRSAGGALGGPTAELAGSLPARARAADRTPGPARAAQMFSAAQSAPAPDKGAPPEKSMGNRGRIPIQLWVRHA